MDTQVIKINKEMLSELYDKYNKEYFEGKLKRPMKFSVYKGSGSVGVINTPRNKKGRVKNIGIAKNIDWTESSLRDTIVHEMIHAYLYQNGMPCSKHGKVFKTVMRELNKKYGLNVEIIDTENWFNDKKPTLFQRITRWIWIKIRLAI
jgi:hypothetical protein